MITNLIPRQKKLARQIQRCWAAMGAPTGLTADTARQCAIVMYRSRFNPDHPKVYANLVNPRRQPVQR